MNMTMGLRKLLTSKMMAFSLLLLGSIIIQKATTHRAFAATTPLPKYPLPKLNQRSAAVNKTAVELPEEQRVATPSTINPAIEITEITEPDGTTIILPPEYDAARSYPALVLMPYTDRTALHMFNWGIYEAYRQRRENSFIIIMPPGQGSSANWSGPGWEALVSDYEAYIQQDIPSFVTKYNVNTEQLVIGGFSLGGDLSWTLSLRNPDIFSGAIVMGSLSTYRDPRNSNQLAAKSFRYFMVMGGYDGNQGSMYSALETLDRHAINYHYEEVGNAGHGDLPEQMPNDLFLSAMDYVLAESVETPTLSQTTTP